MRPGRYMAHYVGLQGCRALTGSAAWSVNLSSDDFDAGFLFSSEHDRSSAPDTVKHQPLQSTERRLIAVWFMLTETETKRLKRKKYTTAKGKCNRKSAAQKLKTWRRAKSTNIAHKISLVFLRINYKVLWIFMLPVVEASVTACNLSLKMMTMMLKQVFSSCFSSYEAKYPSVSTRQL